jgi:hypothetical protein
VPIRLVTTLVLAVVLAVSAGASAGTTRTANRWPAAYEQSFLTSCSATSKGRIAACRCALHWLEQRYTYRQITNIYLHYPTRFRKIIVQSVLACAG